MIWRVQKDQRNLAALDVPGATVRVSDPIRGAGDKLSAGRFHRVCGGEPVFVDL